MSTVRLSWKRAARLLVVTLSSLAGACSGGSSPTTPTPTLQISCPAPVTAESVTGEPRGVDLAPATATGGTTPVTVTCAPASGATFPVGTTAVKCTAVDARQQQAACEYNVTVTQPGQLSATRFLAFGDSITFGTIPTPCQTAQAPAGMSAREAVIRDFRFLSPRADPPSSAYPNVLTQLLAGRYVSQSITVVNSGNPGEFITEPGGGTLDPTLDRLRGELSSRQPQVLLLLHGTNDLLSFNHEPDRTPRIAKALGDMIHEARSRGVQTFLATLLPEDGGGCRGIRGFDLVTTANDHIRNLAASEGVPLVDMYAAFGGVPGPYIGIDGLHGTPEGYEKMAQTFLTAIRQRLEVPR